MKFSAKIHDSTGVELQHALDLDRGIARLEVYLVAPSRYMRFLTREQLIEGLNVFVRFSRVDGPRVSRTLGEMKRSLTMSPENYRLFQHAAQDLCSNLYLLAGDIISQLKLLTEELWEENPEKFTTNIEALLQQISRFRKDFIREWSKASLNVPREIQQCVRLIDEYLSSKLLLRVGGLLHRISEPPDKLVHIVAGEQDYRSRVLTDAVMIQEDAEAFVSRMGGLKKVVDAPLFVNLKRSRQDKIYRNYFAGIGAGVAAGWSLLAEAQTHSVAASQDFYFRHGLIASLGILAYIFKDRIKENSRELMRAKVMGRLCDFKTNLMYHAEGGGEQKIGRVKEWFEETRPSDLPQELQIIFGLKGHSHSLQIEQKIQCYRRTIIPARNDEHLLPSRRLKEIIRLDLSRFCRALDDSEKRMFFLEEKESQEVRTARRYQVDILVRCCEGDSIGLSHYRVTAKNGVIQEMETVSPYRRL